MSPVAPNVKAFMRQPDKAKPLSGPLPNLPRTVIHVSTDQHPDQIAKHMDTIRLALPSPDRQH